VSEIDLRSDTVTLPTADMLRAMTSAPLGDDVFGDDPTVVRLEETAAERMGKEAALFVASGTMGNLLGLLVNAAIAVGTDVRTIAQYADTVSFCLSKGLCCPVGSVLCGPAGQIRQARRWRKMLGGGMRQAGVLAAAGLVALDTMVDRLADDHRNAHALAEGLSGLPGIDCDLSRVQTNLVYFRLKNMDAASFLAACSGQRLLGGAYGPDLVRFVTHHGIGPADIQRALAICREALRWEPPRARPGQGPG